MGEQREATRRASIARRRERDAYRVRGGANGHTDDLRLGVVESLDSPRIDRRCVRAAAIARRWYRAVISNTRASRITMVNVNFRSYEMRDNLLISVNF